MPLPKASLPSALNNPQLVAPAQSSPSAAPTWFGNLPSSFNFHSYKAPTTGSQVYVGTDPTSGQEVYVGPNNLPYVGSASDFTIAGGLASPNRTAAGPIAAQATSWNALGFTGANDTVTESTYSGPGADTSATDNTYFQQSIPAGSKLLVGAAASALSGDAPGLYTSLGGGNFADQNATAPAGPTTALQAAPDPTLAAIAAAVNAAGPTDASAGVASTPTGTTGAADPLASLAGVLANLGGGGGTSGGSAVPTDYGASPIAPSSTGVQATPIPTSSGPNPLILLALVAALAIGGWYLYQKYGHEHGRNRG